MGHLDATVVAGFTKLFHEQLKISGRATTLARILTSQHTRELRWIGLTVTGLIAAFVAVELWSLFQAKQLDATRLLSLGVLGGALSWAYNTGNQRLGTVDLFACEISTLCRVGLILDFAQRELDKLEPAASLHLTGAAGDPAAAEQFTSKESYTPVFDSTLRSLESLDIYVVSKITEFYTYRKTMVDYLRKARALPAGSEKWREAMAEMLYLQYVMFESGRHAIEQLIEYDPDQEESLINIMCTELTLFPYLTRVTNNDFRCERLLLRRPEYLEKYASIAQRVATYGDRPEWQRAATTFRELTKRYQAALPYLVDPGTAAPSDHRIAA